LEDVVKSVTDPGNRTTAFTYDIRGRQIEVNAPDTLDAEGNNLTNITFTAYNPDSTVQETSGAQTYRTTHTYDYAQRQVTMTTYGTETATTEWKYSPDRGFLTEKNYHGETDDGNVDADYTYTAAGRLLTRTWERGKHTRYAYDAAGRMESTRYFLSRNDDTGTNPGNDADTPDITITHDALGRQLTQSNGVAQSTFAYNPGNLAIDTETVQYDLDPGTAGFEFTRVLDRSQDTLQRDSGWDLKNGTTIENSVRYDYSPTDGRISSISNPQLSNVSFAYGYVPGSSLIETVTGPAHTVTNSWESTRDVLDSKENKVGTTTVSGYLYGVNAIGQRTNVAQTGTAFGSVRDIAWGYDSLGQVTKADSTIPGLDRAYQFDLIGNRLKSADSLTLPASNNYTPNALNQYTTVNGVNPVHDADGNMTSGPLPANVNANSTLIWDGENRLIEAQVTGGATVNFTYDSQSRRIAETVGTTTKITIYDGWNPITDYTGSVGVPPTISKANLWGMDLSGSMQGAGGVVGLLAVTDSTSTYYPTYDGNGNISEYLNSSGAVVAHYEYDPFGKTTVATGLKVQDFTHRFSTKPLDATTGLYYYGYRYYDPVTGRWPSRDPIGEEGGINLYAFVGNDGVNKIDVLGMQGRPGPLVDFWLIRRTLLPTGHSVADQIITSLNLKHEFILKSKNPCDPLDTDTGYGFYSSGVTKEKLTLHQNTTAQRYRKKGPRSVFQAGPKKGKKCHCASTAEILECVKTFPPAETYYVPPTSLTGIMEFLTGKKYACDDWVEDAAAGCCLKSSNVKKTCGQN
jgi:RHS repeat-associated protein